MDPDANFKEQRTLDVPDLCVVYKYKVTPFFTLQLPESARVLTAQVQGYDVQMWVRLNPGLPTVSRHFRAMPTGVVWSTPPCGELHYISTWQQEGLVFHLFEETKA